MQNIHQKTLQNFYIIKELVLAEFKLRYQGSVLGYFWTLVKPLMLFGVIYLVFSVFMPAPVPHYPIYLLIGILIWNFFAEATLIGMNSLPTRRDLITKIYFPRANIVFASTISSLITLLLNLIVLAIFLIASGLHPTWISFIFIVYIAELFLIATGITLILSTLYLFFRDMMHIWEILLQIGFWLTPIIYSVQIIPFKYHRYIYLNPLARIIEYSRDIFVNNHLPSFSLNFVLLLMTLAIFVSGYLIFKSQEHKIAEKI